MPSLSINTSYDLDMSLVKSANKGIFNFPTPPSFKRIDISKFD